MSTLSWRVFRLPLLLSLLWCLLLLFLFRWTVQREDEYATELARIQTKTLFTTIVDTRAWNANSSGVWVRESPNYPPNPWLPEDERTLRDENGRLLIHINPSYMTRLIAENYSSPLASFRISSLSPKRPENRADQWESRALRSFTNGTPDTFELTQGKKGLLYRYMAPLAAKEACLHCHPQNKAGDILGGISVSISADPLLDAAARRKKTTGLAFGLIGLIGVVGIGGATFQINRKRELAEASNRAKSAFLANMTHDMRTPLTGIVGMTDLLEREASTGRHRFLLANLREAANSLLTLVDGIMRYSLLEADRQPAPCVPFSLRTELEACTSILRPACTSRDLGLTVLIDDSVPDRLRGDSFRLRQAIGNLLGNAVKFTEKGSVTLRVARKSGEAAEEAAFLSFQIIDTGSGIPREEQERIFETFEQGSGAQQKGDAGNGVGLGLSIARSIARRFGGDLTLSSTPGMGSVFTMTARFELAAPGDAIPEPPQAAPAAQALPQAAPGTRLLVAEDSPVTALFFDEVLAKAGYDVKTAATGQEVLRLLCEHRPALAVLDIRLPDMTGIDIARRIRSGEAGIPADLPILVLSASIDTSEEAAFRHIGVNRWMLKPVQADSLLMAVATLLPEQRAENAAPSSAPGSASPTIEGSGPSTAPSAPAEPAVFNLDAALDGLGNDALLRRLAGIFLGEETNVRAALLNLMEHPESLPARCAELRRQAHSLKNGAGMLHLDVLRLASSALEAAAADPADQDFPALLRAAIDALDEASTALRRHCGA